MTLDIKKYTNSIAQENSYLLSNASFNFVIDPGSEPEQLIADLKASGKPLASIFLSHAHFDHIMGLDELLLAFPDAMLFLHAEEHSWLQDPKLNASQLFLGQPVTSTAQPNAYIIRAPYLFGETELSVRYTPGHSIGGVSLIFEKEKIVFSGDALFYHTIGRTDLPTGNQEQLLTSIHNELLSLPDDYVIYPGHGPRTSVGEEKQNNPYL
ncbi:MBL fold metallo-hydrolase [Lactococcus termiticola]|uniref:Metallo-beta-lactamase domain protein n=1 Tax=Lactococcus termiticola TaxID=2169526 RepID=A0A2R5HK22_9LACT|nr:MBL fold metallo-hydrolase [Lactococcus termiticola]GBG96791.1 metallo-beta-lactamase domain protein [Lactococcus termiticola]